MCLCWRLVSALPPAVSGLTGCLTNDWTEQGSTRILVLHASRGLGCEGRNRSPGEISQPLGTPKHLWALQGPWGCKILQEHGRSGRGRVSRPELWVERKLPRRWRPVPSPQPPLGAACPVSNAAPRRLQMATAPWTMLSVLREVSLWSCPSTQGNRSSELVDCRKPQILGHSRGNQALPPSLALTPRCRP